MFHIYLTFFIKIIILNIYTNTHTRKGGGTVKNKILQFESSFRKVSTDLHRPKHLILKIDSYF